MSPSRTGGGQPLAAGETVLLIDRKERRYLVSLRPGGSFQSHAGLLEHDRIIGRFEGSELSARQGGGHPDGTAVPSGSARTTSRSTAVYTVWRPRLADLVLQMPRGAQVIYPKDLAAIVMKADVAAGCSVLEAGVGSGALSMALVRAGAIVTGYELREDFAATAMRNVARLPGATAVSAFHVELRDVYDGIDPGRFDRILLDLPEPWRVVDHARTALSPGGILCCYLPTINQTAALSEALQSGGFAEIETVELLERTWHIEGRSVRPDHRMVAHTGFLTVARRLACHRDGA